MRPGRWKNVHLNLWWTFGEPVGAPVGEPVQHRNLICIDLSNLLSFSFFFFQIRSFSNSMHLQQN
ncbi:MAG: hypothetical protein K0R08_1815, partial [Solimicrobium sp.]|nr:hypothetical protein [Solimicrobium sp.]